MIFKLSQQKQFYINDFLLPQRVENTMFFYKNFDTNCTNLHEIFIPYLENNTIVKIKMN